MKVKELIDILGDVQGDYEIDFRMKDQHDPHPFTTIPMKIEHLDTGYSDKVMLFEVTPKEE